MGLAIVILLIGVPIGLFILLRPKKLWWTFRAWRYKNPEANEPSGAGYAMNALGGLVVIGATLLLAWLVATKPDPADDKIPPPWTPPSTTSIKPPPKP